MAGESRRCAHCGQPFSAPTDEARYCSFACEVKALLGGTGQGLRWLAMSLVWGGVVFALLMAVARLVWRGPGGNPAAAFGLVVVLGLMAVIATVLWRRTTL